MGAPIEGRYANYFEIGFTASELLLDFGQMDPQTEAVLIHTRIVTTPPCGKALLAMLADAMRKYEQAMNDLQGGET